VGVSYVHTERTYVSIGSGDAWFSIHDILEAEHLHGRYKKKKKTPAEFLCLKTMLLSIQREAASNRCMLNIVGCYTFAEMAVVYNMCGVHREVK
jgi:hypothetical protein